jgi:NAD-dependent SIR2 family protein deacetylase
LANASSSTTVITTNYDNLAERVLSSRKGLRHRSANTNCHHCKLCAILNDECSCGGSQSSESAWRGSLLKLHGSISWRRCRDSTCSSGECLIPDQHCRPFEDEACPSCGGKCGPVLVPPSMLKTFDRFRGLKQVWNSAFRALSQASSVMFWGFSFPPSDILIRQMVKSAFASNRRKIDFSVIDIDPEKPATILQDLLSDDHHDESTITLYEVPDDGTKPTWLISENANLRSGS